MESSNASTDQRFAPGMGPRDVFGRRILAFMLDSLLIASIFALVALPWVSGSTPPPERIEDIGQFMRQVQSQLALQPIAWAITVGYFFFCEAFWDGRTVGKRALGLQVVMADGSPLTTTAVLKRSLMRFVDELLCSFVVGLLAALTNTERRRLGDRVAGTLVVDARVVSEYGWGRDPSSPGFRLQGPGNGATQGTRPEIEREGVATGDSEDLGPSLPGDPNPWSAR